MNPDEFRQTPLLGILRGIEMDAVEPLVETVVGAGLQTIEITMNTAGAAGLIERMVRVADGRLTIGAGTVLSLDDLRAAGDAGASFIVLPTLVADVVGECVRRSVPVFPGGLTPQEIHHAWWAGATMVKVFPAGAFGPSYIREIKGPFADIELLACGGVNADNLGDYFAAGASAVAFGASVFRGEWFSAREYAQIGAEIEKLIGALRTWQARSG